MSTLAEIDAELARLAEILAEPISWHSRRAREAENEQVRNRIDELLEERLALIERCNWSASAAAGNGCPVRDFAVAALSIAVSPDGVARDCGQTARSSWEVARAGQASVLGAVARPGWPSAAGRGVLWLRPVLAA